MTKTEPSKPALMFLAAASILGLSFTFLLLSAPNLQGDPAVFRRPLIAALYSAILMLGIVAVFYPDKCRLIFQKPNRSLNEDRTTATMKFRGHHPDCEKYSANRITFWDRTYCAACSGLLSGAAVALVGIILFALGYLDFAAANLWVLVSGSALMLLGLAQVKMEGFLKLTVNAFFVVGSLFCLVAVDSAGQSLLLDGYMLTVIVFLLWFRIRLSEWHNNQTCLRCARC
ncbi:MAG: hypothetical protein NWE93_06575 [Candidatus Bathyarchaeota archaeon]|nr:hypothetical protein [Candidatus Bathyarchaeota archaeon]